MLSFIPSFIPLSTVYLPMPDSMLLLELIDEQIGHGPYPEGSYSLPRELNEGNK